MSQPEYQVMAQVRSSQLDESGRRASQGWAVTFKDAQTGVSGEVFVADDFYTPDNVRTMILARLRTIRQVHALTD